MTKPLQPIKNPAPAPLVQGGKLTEARGKGRQKRHLPKNLALPSTLVGQLESLYEDHKGNPALKDRLRQALETAVALRRTLRDIGMGG